MSRSFASGRGCSSSEEFCSIRAPSDSLNYDTYVLGYSGYLLPALLAAILVYAAYRRFFLVVLALNVGILGFLLSAGRSLNLWDYVIDPVAWLFAIGAWIAIVPGLLSRKPVVAPSLAN